MGKVRKTKSVDASSGKKPTVRKTTTKKPVSSLPATTNTAVMAKPREKKAVRSQVIGYKGLSSLLTAIKNNEMTVTENGMPTPVTSNDPCLDLFYKIGAMKGSSDQDVRNAFIKAYTHNPQLATAIALHSRDILLGGGARKQFQVIMKYLAEVRDMKVENSLALIPNLGIGYWKDIFALQGTNYEMAAVKHVADNIMTDGLLAKWMPRYGWWFQTMRRYMKMSPTQFRKHIVSLTKVVEQQMCANEWSEINYSHVPSIASSHYSKAFKKHDEVRYKQFLEKATKGEVKINAKAIYPHQIVANLNNDREQSIAQWNQLPNFLQDNKERMIPICDVSGSMDGEPMNVSLALGLYISERNEGIFKDAFINFSGTPQLCILKGNLADRVSQMHQYGHDWGSNTNIEAVFRLILENAMKHKVAEGHMPTQILIMSDMQFDQCYQMPNATAMQMIQTKYNQYGYKMPNIVFWNLRDSSGVPVKGGDHNVALVSGFSPSILLSLLKGKSFTPFDVMLDAVWKPRYLFPYLTK